MARSRQATHGIWVAWACLAIFGLLVLQVLLAAQAHAPIRAHEAMAWLFVEFPALAFAGRTTFTQLITSVVTWSVDASALTLRLPAIVLLGWGGWLMFAATRRAFDARTGFWAVICFLLCPLVVIWGPVSLNNAGLAWCGALATLALLRLEADRTATLLWPMALGATIGIAMMADLTVAVLIPALALRWFYFAPGRPRPRQVVTGLIALVFCWSPDFLWRLALPIGTMQPNSGDSPWMIVAAGPILFAAPVVAFVQKGSKAVAKTRVTLVWIAIPALAAILLEGSIAYALAPLAMLAAHGLLILKRRGFLIANAVICAGVALSVWFADASYDAYGDGLPMRYDPSANAREAAAFCDSVLQAHDGSGGGRIAINRLDLLSICAWAGRLEPGRLALWQVLPGDPRISRALDPGRPGPTLAIVARIDAVGAELRDTKTAARLVDQRPISSHRDNTAEMDIWELAVDP